MNDSPTILRRASGDPGPSLFSLEESDPLLASGIRKRIAALAVVAAAAYSVTVPLDLAIHAGFGSPAAIACFT